MRLKPVAGILGQMDHIVVYEENDLMRALLKELDQILKDNPAALKQVLQAIQEAQAAVAVAGKGK